MTESQFDFEVVKIAGTPGESYWSGNFAEKPTDLEKLGLRGQLFLVVGLKTDDNPADSAHKFWTELTGAFYNNTAAGLLTALQEAARLALDKLLTGISFSESGFVAASIWGRILYLVCAGKASAVLVRSGESSQILRSDSEKPDQLVCASGFLQDGDLVILATDEFFKIFGADFAKIENITTPAIEEELASKITQSENSEKIAVCILKIKESEREDVTDLVTFATGEFKPSESKAPTASLVRLLQQQIERIWVGFLSAIVKGLNLLGKLSPRRGIYLKFGKGRLSRKSVFTLIILGLVIVLVVSLSVGIWQREQRISLQKFEQFYQKAETSYEEAVGISTINRLRSRELLTAAAKNLDSAKKYNFQKTKVGQLAEKIEKLNQESLKLVKIDSPNLIFDLALVKSAATISEIEKPGNLLAFDKSNPTLFTVDLKSKTGQITAGGDKFLGFSNFTSSAKFAYFFKPADGIYQFDLDKNQLKKVISPDSHWGEILDLQSYGDNLYLLDAKSGQVWKYTKAGEAFSDIKGFLVNAPKINFSNSSFAIDGAIWILDGAGKIYQTGPKETKLIEIAGLDKLLSPKTILRTNDEADNLYIADLGNSRVLVFNKSGLYLAQYSSGLFSQLTDFVVDEKLGKLYFAAGSKVFSIDLVK